MGYSYLVLKVVAQKKKKKKIYGAKITVIICLTRGQRGGWGVVDSWNIGVYIKWEK